MGDTGQHVNAEVAAISDYVTAVLNGASGASLRAHPAHEWLTATTPHVAELLAKGGARDAADYLAELADAAFLAATSQTTEHSFAAVAAAGQFAETQQLAVAAMSDEAAGSGPTARLTESSTPALPKERGGTTGSGEAPTLSSTSSPVPDIQRPPDNLTASATPPDDAATENTTASATQPDATATENTAARATQPDDVAATSAATAATEPDTTDTLAALYAELDNLVGLTSVKAQVRRQAEALRIAGLRAKLGKTNPTLTRHLVFTGNPGTGKTTVARLVARIYHVLGVLPKDTLVEVDKSGLVAGYVGQTEERTAKVIDSALGGVLFIDEAYALSDDTFGETAIHVIVKAVEDHRDDLVVILAGYTGPMAELLDVNPGLSSRFPTTIEFPDYSDAELLTICERMVATSEYTLADGARPVITAALAALPRDETFGNARAVRNLFEAAVANHAWRLRDVAEPTETDLCLLTAADFATERPADWPP